MRRSLSELAARFTGQSAALVALSIWLLLVCIYLFATSSLHVQATPCLFRNATGLPCPTCGATRAAQAMIAGHPIEAVLWNPLLVLGGGVALCWIVLCYVTRRSVTPPMARRWRVMAWIGFAVAFAANWAYVISIHMGR